MFSCICMTSSMEDASMGAMAMTELSDEAQECWLQTRCLLEALAKWRKRCEASTTPHLSKEVLQCTRGRTTTGDDHLYTYRFGGYKYTTWHVAHLSGPCCFKTLRHECTPPTTQRSAGSFNFTSCWACSHALIAAL